ncbi:MAG: hypothetical protein AB8B56_13880 [Crocinitomicaceae bacterium]
MKQYSVDDEVIKLTVKRPNVALIALLAFITFVTFAGPVMGIILTLAAGNGFHIGLFFGAVISGLIGFYLLRNTLWNMYGQEIISLKNNELEYVADYGWFQDKVKSVQKSSELELNIQTIGYEDENKGVLVITTEDDSIQCATKMDIAELEELIILFQKERNKWIAT